MTTETLTRERARAAKQREERGYLFPLPYTGGQARVRRIPLAKLASVTGLSAQMQATVLEVFREIQSGGTFSIRSWQDLAQNQRRQEELANGLCIAGFLAPRLVESEGEAEALDDPHVLCVDEIDIRDRLAYLQTVMAPESEAAKAMEPFPADGLEGARPDEGLPPATPPVDGAAVAAGNGVQPASLPVV